ncbi:hypothetical protein [Acutalibacter intestini]|uniref:hypothetical protein n=1 Tax=Acutalibacter intestini TaxID=3093659 RepID=UPI002AC943BD|nr:hypothetical protein [Acutalibacter sp. M00204]
MKNQQAMENNKEGTVLTMIGVAIMILLTATKVVPSSNIASYSVFVGIAFIFIVEAVSKTPNAESGLRFNMV